MDTASHLPALTLRGVTFDPPLFCAPMAAITHSAFRRVLADFGGYGALCTEMLSARMLRHENPDNSPWLKRRPQEGKVIYQLLATDTRGLAEAIERLAPLKPDGLDLNLACSAFNVTRQGGGAALFDDDPRMRAIVRTIRQSFAGPFTAKLRLGYEAPDWREKLRHRFALLREEGVDAITLHPRFQEEKFRRAARHPLYAELAAEAGLPLIANGDIASAAYYRERAALFAPAAGLMIGRMVAAQPWFFAQWHNPGLAVDRAEVWARLTACILEDFEPTQALIRLKILAPYYARNFLFGHQFFKAVHGAGDLASACDRAAAFLAANPEPARTVSVDGL
jgi:tRNA-dihydrouridine synthase